MDLVAARDTLAIAIVTRKQDSHLLQYSRPWQYHQKNMLEKNQVGELLADCLTHWDRPAQFTIISNVSGQTNDTKILHYFIVA